MCNHQAARHTRIVAPHIDVALLVHQIGLFQICVIPVAHNGHVAVREAGLMYLQKRGKIAAREDLLDCAADVFRAERRKLKRPFACFGRGFVTELAVISRTERE